MSINDQPDSDLLAQKIRAAASCDDLDALRAAVQGIGEEANRQIQMLTRAVNHQERQISLMQTTLMQLVRK